MGWFFLLLISRVTFAVDCDSRFDGMIGLPSGLVSLGTELGAKANIEPVLKVDPACERNFPEFSSQVRDALRVGRECLMRLNTQGSFTAGAGLNLSLYNELYRSRPLSFICSNESIPSKDLQAKASTLPGDPSGYPHPYIAINHALTSKDRALRDPQKFKAMVFHESLHNLNPGYVHGNSFEFFYACEACCFPNEETALSGPEAEFGCRVCQGNYSSPNDPAYLRDLFAFASANNYRDIPQQILFDTLTKYLRAGGKAKQIPMLFIHGASNLDAVGISLAKLQTLEQTPAADRGKLLEVQGLAELSTIRKVRPLSDAIAAGFQAYLSEGDPRKAMKTWLGEITARDFLPSCSKSISPNCVDRSVIDHAIHERMRSTLVNGLWLLEATSELPEEERKSLINFIRTLD